VGIHPAGVVILLYAVGAAFVIRRGFCSWLCPVGTVSELLWRLGGKLGINWKPWKWLDIPLRGLKYLLLGFFLYAILGMSSEMLLAFLNGGYNKVSDVKMLNFFIAPSSFTLKVLAILALLSLAVKNAWCRYLCPYGALLGFFSWLSPMKIRRDIATCIDCNKCTKACPSFLPVAMAKRISSVECLACQQCVAVCPVKDCLTFSLPKKRWNLKPAWYGFLFVALFLGSVGIARLSGYWQSSIDVEELRGLVKQAEMLGHPRDLSGYKE
jgi:polyferredoxin